VRRAGKTTSGFPGKPFRRNVKPKSGALGPDRIVVVEVRWPSDAGILSLFSRKGSLMSERQSAELFETRWRSGSKAGSQRVLEATLQITALARAQKKQNYA
jgi:hypothetical protein